MEEDLVKELQVVMEVVVEVEKVEVVEVVAVVDLCGACNQDMVEEVGRDLVLKKLADTGVRQGNKLQEMFAWLDLSNKITNSTVTKDDTNCDCAKLG